MKKIITTIVLAFFYVSYIVYDRTHPALSGVSLQPPVLNLMAGQQASGTTAAGSADPPAAQNVGQASISLQQPSVGTQHSSSSSSTAPLPNPSLGPIPTPTPTPVPVPVPTPVPTPTPSPTPAPQPQGQYKDGQYTGPSVDALYGLVQVQATISGGKLTNVQFLSYPNDNPTSLSKSNKAVPILAQEAIAAQSANVNSVSGASETSQAFVQSLGAALAQAKV